MFSLVLWQALHGAVALREWFCAIQNPRATCGASLVTGYKLHILWMPQNLPACPGQASVNETLKPLPSWSYILLASWEVTASVHSSAHCLSDSILLGWSSHWRPEVRATYTSCWALLRVLALNGLLESKEHTIYLYLNLVNSLVHIPKPHYISKLH
jgi:hypothetical protein